MAAYGADNFLGIKRKLIHIDVATSLEKLKGFIKRINPMYGRYSVRIQITQTTYFIVGHVTQLFIYAKLYLLASLMKDIQRAILAFSDVKFNHVCLLQKCRLKRCNGIARDISACHATMCHEDDMIFSLLAKIKLTHALPPLPNIFLCIHVGVMIT